MTVNSKKVIDFYIKRISKSNWELINRTDNGIQIRQIKQVKMIGFWVGLVLMPFWGIGFILWLLVLLDYALQREKIRFIDVDTMIKQLKEAK
jgi:hypothetical protein